MRHLLDRLTSEARKLEIIPIVGMGGIGKTTLARNLYNDPLIFSHFDVRAWVTVSQDHNMRAILLDLLGCIIGKLPHDVLKAENEKLEILLHKSLYGKRYLIVVDDIWSAEAWNEMKRFFPNEDHRSRILLTTRELDVAKHADSSCEEHQMHPLNNLQSWELLQHKAFGEETCPPSLVGIGQIIANDCGGLPLAINVIGGLLSTNKNSKDFWEQIARDVISVIAEKVENFPNILNLSYKYLPHHLKPCLLYMTAFPEDYEVRTSKLIKLWEAEGFLKKQREVKYLEEQEVAEEFLKKQIGSKYLEEEVVAEEYLKALVDRNLLLVQQYKSNGKAKSYSIHDLLRELCVKKAREEKFVCLKNGKVGNIQEETLYENVRRVSVHQELQIEDVFAFKKYMALARTFLCPCSLSSLETFPVFVEMKLLRVLDVLPVFLKSFPIPILQLVNLRFLAFSTGSEVPSEISRLRTLQTLIVALEYHALPSEVWERLELRHIKMMYDASELDLINMFKDGYQITQVQEKLETLSLIPLDDLVRTGMLTKIPNIKKLGVVVNFFTEDVDLSHLRNLETLMFKDALLSPLPEIKFPPSMRTLTLDNCTISISFMSIVGSLPNLQVLKIRRCVFKNGQETSDAEAEWEPNEGGFQSLQFLLLEEVENLVRWNADDTHFPTLRHLVIRNCKLLVGIPTSIGDIVTLDKIELDESNPSLVASAREIEEEQRSTYANESLQILIHPWQVI